MPVGRKPNQAELTAIRRFAPDMEPDGCMIYRHLMVGDQIVPNRFLRLDPKKTLPMFQKDTAAGAPWIFNHNYYNPVTFGRAYAAELVKEPCMALVEKDGKLVEQEVEATHLYGDFYMPMGVELTGAPQPTTDKMAQQIELGLAMDTSIGFSVNEYRCSICGNDIRDWRKCEHWPGQVYTVEVEGRTERRICIADCIGGMLIEESSVFAGAYPMAHIVRQGAAPDGSAELEPVPDEDLKTLPMGVQAFHTFNARTGLQTFVPAGTKRQDREQFAALSAPALKEGALGTTAGTEEQGAGGAGKADPVTFTASVDIGGRSTALSVTAELLATLPETIELGATGAPDTSEVDGLRAEVASLTERLTASEERANTAEATAQQATERATTAEAGAQEANNRAEAAEQALSGAQDRMRTALGLSPDADPVAEVERLAPDLQDTVTYREHLITEALAMGVRAYGNTFGADGWETYLRAPGRTLAELQTQFAAFEGETRKRLPPGRLSIAPKPPGQDPEPEARDSHTYRVWRKPGN